MSKISLFIAVSLNYQMVMKPLYGLYMLSPSDSEVLTSYT